MWDHLDRIGVRMYRMASSVIPYGTHPDLPEFDYRRQIHDCADALAALGARARAQGLRLSTHPGQYTVINGDEPGLRDRSLAEIESHTALLDAMGMGPESTVVVHVGGMYGDRASALDRWAAAFGRLSESARGRIGLENDERLFHAGDVLELHRRTGVRVVYDWHHARIHPAPDLADADALAAAMATWPRRRAAQGSPVEPARLGRRGETPGPGHAPPPGRGRPAGARVRTRTSSRRGTSSS